MLPGSPLTKADAIVLDAVKFLLSAMRILPPLFSCTGFNSDMRKITGSVPPHSTPAATWSASRSPGSSPGHDPPRPRPAPCPGADGIVSAEESALVGEANREVLAALRALPARQHEAVV